jgi:hypothetical protein
MKHPKRRIETVRVEAGNSAATIFSHYRALATETEGQAWFAIEPEHGPRT